MLSKLSEGAFGTVSSFYHHISCFSFYCCLQVYIAEADGISEYSSTLSLGTRLVAIKFLGEDASDKEK